MNIVLNHPTFNGMPVKTAEMIAEEILAARRAEKAAAERRIELEKEMIALLGIMEEGSKTHTLDGYKVVIKQDIDRKIDWSVYDQIADRIPASLQPVKIKRDVDPTGVKYLKNNEPDLYAVLVPALTVKPAKPSVTVTRIE